MDFTVNIWYLIKVKNRMEEIAEINLTNQSIEYFLPRFTSGKREGKVVFPGYLFVKPSSNDSFQSIRYTKGVSDFVRFNMSFAIANDNTIEELRKLVYIMNDRIDRTKLHKRGEEILIKAGPFKDFNAIFEKYDANQSATVLINFLRSQQKVNIKLDAIS